MKKNKRLIVILDDHTVNCIETIREYKLILNDYSERITKTEIVKEALAVLEEKYLNENKVLN